MNAKHLKKHAFTLAFVVAVLPNLVSCSLATTLLKEEEQKEEQETMYHIVLSLQKELREERVEFRRERQEERRLHENRIKEYSEALEQSRNVNGRLRSDNTQLKSNNTQLKSNLKYEKSKKKKVIKMSKNSFSLLQKISLVQGLFGAYLVYNGFNRQRTVGYTYDSLERGGNVRINHTEQERTLTGQASLWGGIANIGSALVFFSLSSKSSKDIAVFEEGTSSSLPEDDVEEKE